MKYVYVKYSFAFLWTVFIIWILTLSGNKIPRFPLLSLLFVDKIIHLTLFFIWGVLMLWALMNTNFKLKLKVIVVIVIGFMLGSVLEYIQPLVAELRTRDIWDAIFNFIGVFIGTSVMYKYYK